MVMMVLMVILFLRCIEVDFKLFLRFVVVVLVLVLMELSVKLCLMLLSVVWLRL